MHYYWDKRSLLKALKDLTLLASQEKDLEKKSYYFRCIDDFNNFMFGAYTDCPSTKTSAQDNLIAATNSMTYNGRYFSIINKFYELLEPVEETLINIETSIQEEIVDKGPNTFFHSEPMTHEETMNLVKDFFQSIDSELAFHFEELYKNRFTSITFDEASYSLGEHFSTEGNCIFVDGIRKCFINVSDDKNIRKYQNLIHECAHAIVYFMNPKREMTSNHMYIKEVESIFMELVALTELDDNKKDEANFLLVNLLLEYYDKTEALVFQNRAIDAWARNNYQVNKEYFKMLNKQFGISKDLFNEIISEDIELSGMYIISYLISLVLLHLYKTDKDKAMSLYKKIISDTGYIDEHYFIQELLNFDYIKDEVLQTVEEAKKLLKKRGV